MSALRNEPERWLTPACAMTLQTGGRQGADARSKNPG
jgi:hypothetical protein